MTHLVLQLVRPYRGWLVIVFVAMLVEIAMSLAAPWPLKLVLDDALGHHQLPSWLDWAHLTTALAATRSASRCSPGSRPW